MCRSQANERTHAYTTYHARGDRPLLQRDLRGRGSARGFSAFESASADRFVFESLCCQKLPSLSRPSGQFLEQRCAPEYLSCFSTMSYSSHDGSNQVTESPILDCYQERSVHQPRRRKCLGKYPASAPVELIVANHGKQPGLTGLNHYNPLGKLFFRKRSAQ